MKPLTLCADDLGLSDAISSAIVELARGGKINAASLMTDGPEALPAAAAMAAIPGCALGLHIALSDGLPAPRSELAPEGTLPHVDGLTMRAFRGRLPLAAIGVEIDRQFDRFISGPPQRLPRLFKGEQLKF